MAPSNPTELSTVPPSSLANPSLGQGRQGVKLESVVVGPPGYGSPDPATAQGRLVPLADHPLKDAISAHYGQDSLPKKAENKKGRKKGGKKEKEDAASGEGGDGNSGNGEDS